MPLPKDPTSRLFARSLDEITDLYIEPITTRQLVLAGTARLAALDDKLTISESPATHDRMGFAVNYAGRTVATPSLPGAPDSQDWGILVGNLIAAAKQASPKVAAMPQEAIDKAVFDGITGLLDRFSRYSTPEIAREQRAARDGFGGIGVTLDGADGFKVTAVTAQGPADRAGIRPDDRVVAIDGRPTAGLTQSEVIRQLRGPIASSLTVTIQRPGGPQPRQVQLRRALVVVPTVAVSRTGNVPTFRIAGFNQSTTKNLAAALTDMQRQAGGRLDGIILDLRSNPGGLLDQAVSLADLFIHDGPIVSTVGRHPASKQYFGASGDGIAPRLPIAVLINGGSASASEIVAAALQDVGRAVVIGTSSYGKGTVQTVLRLPNEGELTLTWARLVAPSGYLLQTHGVIPTVCTGDLIDNDTALQTAMQRAGGTAPGALSAPRARAALDERGWQALRNACPARPTSPALDVKLAERLLSDPRLYSAALEATHPGTRPAIAATEPFLTGVDGALSSRTRVP